MKNIVVIIVCLLVSAWAVSIFFDSTDNGPDSARTQSGVKQPAVPTNSSAAATQSFPVKPNRPGQAVRLELPFEKENTRENTEIASKVSTPAADQVARAVRVAPREKKEVDSLDPIPEPAVQVAAEFVVQEGHAGDIEGLAFGPNGKYLATAEYNKRVKLWDLKTGQLIRTFHHNLAYEHGPIVEFSQNGQALYTGGGMPFTIRTWDLATDKLVREAVPKSVVDFQKGPDGKKLVGYGWGKLTILDAKYLGAGRVMKSKHQWGSFEAVVMDSRYCYSGHSNGTIAHWDIDSGSQLHEFVGHKGVVKKLFVDKSGKFLISVGWEDGQVKIWNKQTFELIQTFQAHAPDSPRKRNHLHSAVLDPSHRYLLTGGSDGYIKVWSLKKGHPLRTFQKAGLSQYEEIRRMDIDPTGTYVAAGGREGRIWVWDFNSGQIIRKISGRLPQESHRDASGYQSEEFRKLNDANLADVPLIVDVDPGMDHVGVRNDREEYAVWDIQGARLLKHFPAGEKVTFCKLGPFGKRAFTGHKDERLNLWDLGTGVLLKELNPPNPAMQVSWIKVRPDAKTLVSLHQLSGKFKYDKNNVLNIWDLATGNRVASMQGWHHVRIDPQWRFLLALKGKKEKTVFRYDFKKNQVRELYVFSTYFNSFSLIRDGQIAVICDTNNKLYFWNTETGKPLPSPEVGDEVKKRVLIDYTGRYVLYAPCIESSVDSRYDAISSMAAAGRDHSPWEPDIGKPKDILVSSIIRQRRRGRKFKSAATIWDIDRAKVACRIDTEGELVTVKLIPARDVAISASSNTIKTWSLKTGKPVREIELTKNYCINRFTVDQAGKQFVASSCRGLYVGDLQTGKIVTTYKDLVNLRLLLIMNDMPLSQNPIVLCMDKLDVGTFIDLKTGAKLEVGQFGLANRLRPEFIANGRVLAYSRRNSNVIDVWNLANPERLSLVSGGREWLAYTSKGYFDSSRYGGRLIAMVDGLDVFGVDQFAIRNNRPDLILQTMGLGASEQKQHFYYQYRKRLRKSGFTPEQLSDDLHVPEAEIKNTRQRGKFLEITFKLKDDRYRLKQYGIYVNDVPVFGSRGRPLEGRQAEVTETVEMTSGKNKIEISCLNEKGAESYRALTYAAFNEPARGDLYFIGFGVSNYKDTRLNLKYAHKDALDLEAVFKKMTADYNKVYHRAFVNEEVSVTAIKQIKKLLAKAKVDDTLVLFIAGHGVHDADAATTYYYLTHDADLKNLPDTGASFEIIEELLADARPRKKLFLMDTCESGEINESIQRAYLAMAGSRGFKARTTRAVRVFGREERKRAARRYLYNADRYIYNELARRSGAIVFSSSRGGEFSYESDTVENGFFTEAVIAVLSGQSTPKGKMTVIDTDQLRSYVSKSVADMSAGLQHPTVDRDNIYQVITLRAVE